MNYIPLKLPSKCIPYENTDPNAIEIRPFIGEDSEILSQDKNKNIFKRFKKIIERCLRGIDPGLLTMGDIVYITLWQAINSYSGKVDLEFVCEHCFKSLFKSIDLDKELNSEDLSEDYLKSQTKEIAGSEIKLHLLTLNDSIEIMERSLNNLPTTLYRNALTMENGSTVDENVEFLKSLPLRDINEIEKFQDEFAYGPIMRAPYMCTECKREGEIDVPFRFELLFSFE